MKRIFLFLIVGLFVCCVDNKKSSNNTLEPFNNKWLDYKLMPSIKSSCKNIIFSDSLWRAWNRASASYLFSQMKSSYDYQLKMRYCIFLKGENLRLEFAKTINLHKLLTESDMNTKFYIMELEISGGNVSNYMSLIKERKGRLQIVTYKFFAPKMRWFFYDQDVADMNKFESFFGRLKKNKIKGLGSIVNKFNLTKFSRDSIECYLSYGPYVNDLYVNKYFTLFAREFI
jgi:hypothetical protein